MAKVNCDLTTLSGWSSLPAGTHLITVKAKATGYRDSEASEAVSVTKAPLLDAPVITKSGTTISWDSVDGATEYYVKDDDTTIATVREQSGYEVSMTVGNDHSEYNVKDGDETIPDITGPYPHIYTIRNGEISFDCSGVASNISTTGGVEEKGYGDYHLVFAVTGDGTIYWDSRDPV